VVKEHEYSGSTTAHNGGLLATAMKLRLHSEEEEKKKSPPLLNSRAVG
jgi:hypothetical protein